MAAIFSGGVCDFSKPGVEQVPLKGTYRVLTHEKRSLLALTALLLLQIAGSAQNSMIVQRSSERWKLLSTTPPLVGGSTGADWPSLSAERRDFSFSALRPEYAVFVTMSDTSRKCRSLHSGTDEVDTSSDVVS